MISLQHASEGPGWLSSKARQLAGKVRRFYLHRFRRDFVERQLAKRQGDCGRCAACCKLLFRCPFLDESGPIALCSIHDRRPDNCRFFPIDPRDLADRDLVDPLNPCGYSFSTGREASAPKVSLSSHPSSPLMTGTPAPIPVPEAAPARA